MFPNEGLPAIGGRLQNEEGIGESLPIPFPRFSPRACDYQGATTLSRSSYSLRPTCI